MIYQRFSKRQLLAMLWWQQPRHRDRDALICDGSIRSGKTLCMAVGFILWSMSSFTGQKFAICGKTIQSLRRNVILNLRDWVPPALEITEYRTENKLVISNGAGRENTYFLFGGRDESSYTLIQGITLAGVLLDEVALQPRSFVEQALARCSIVGSKFWFNCNPESPVHWFYTEWVKGEQPEKHNALHLHFTMDDNWALSPAIRRRYESMYAGVFYDRYIRGLWVTAEGLIYDMFRPDIHVYKDTERPNGLPYIASRTIACDYGTANPFVLLDIYDDGETVWVDNEYRWDSRDMETTGGRQKTDGEYAGDFIGFMGEDPQFFCPAAVDPSAASFITALQRRGVYVLDTDNDVPNGIRRTGALFARRSLRIHQRCKGLIEELQSYVWDEKAAQQGVEKPVKAKDHGPDALRYYVNTCLPSYRYGEVK